MELIKASLLSAVMQSGGGSTDYCEYIKNLPRCQGGGIGTKYHYYIHYEQLQNIQYYAVDPRGDDPAAVSDIGDVIFDYEYNKVFQYFCCVYDNTKPNDMLYAVRSGSTFTYLSRSRDKYKDLDTQTYFLYDTYTTTPISDMTMTKTDYPSQYGFNISATVTQPVHWIRYADPYISSEGDSTFTGNAYFSVTDYRNTPIYTSMSQTELQAEIKNIIRDLYTHQS